MTVLDFGAGTCWLSRLLAQLHCRPICCDVSTAALEIGRRLFRELPVVGPMVSQPVFLPFDGVTLDLPDESVDRIVSFDAFHHVPNPEQVVAEFARVLKAGGVVGFSEPGPHHSRSAQSQYEMRTHRVLENDIDLNAISEVARRAGFTAISIKVLADREVTLEEYNLIRAANIEGDLLTTIGDSIRETMTNQSIFFLHKGPVALDSRSHVGLAHVLEADEAERHLAAGEPARFSVLARNVGSATWLNRNAEIYGIVRLGTHLYDRAGVPIDVDHSRHDLPATIYPGDQVRLDVTVPLPTQGRFVIEFDLVAEGVSWFENLGSRPVRVTVQRD